MERFYLDDFLSENDGSESDAGLYRIKDTASGSCNEISFEEVCALIYSEFRLEWEDENSNTEKLLDIQKKAITGCAPEVSFFKQRIIEILDKHNLLGTTFPDWYESLEDGIYQENWGVASIAEWFSDKYRDSSSAKIIGDRIYFLENGRMVLKEQRISEERREQLIRAFLMLTPEERLDKDFHEVYLKDGTRITIFRRGMVKKGQDVIIFRRYIVPNYTFEEQARRGTIPYESIELFKCMVELGYNTAFIGAVRTAKSTFLSTWQTYEKKELEGVMIETDPEIPMHMLMPDAPVVQLIADGDKLKSITKNLLRSDADYFIMAEARDGIALDTVLRAAAKGTRRMKITFHTRKPENFPYDVAGEIVSKLGGNIEYTARRVADSFDYLFHFVQLPDKSKKRLNAIYEMSYLAETGTISMKRILKYDYITDSWKFMFHISDDKREAGIEENYEGFKRFENELRKLSDGQGEK
ncbi:MAG: ATPase [Clostridiales bacterium]|nr:ATPase [Clostridiales bacterium]